MNPFLILGKRCFNLIHGSSHPPDYCPLKKAKESKKSQQKEIYLSNIDKWVLIAAIPLIEENGDVNALIHTVRDISAKKKAEQAFLKSAPVSPHND